MQYFNSLSAILLAGTALFVGQTAAQCTPTGPGVCNVGFIGHIILPLSVGYQWDKMNIYNRNCDIIGGKDYPKAGMAVASQLPYTVVITRLDINDDINRIGFCYAGYCFDGTFACREENLTTICQHAFNC